MTKFRAAGKKVPFERGRERGVPGTSLKSGYFTAVGLYSVKAAIRADYHNKHW